LNLYAQVSDQKVLRNTENARDECNRNKQHAKSLYNPVPNASCAGSMVLDVGSLIVDYIGGALIIILTLIIILISVDIEEVTVADLVDCRGARLMNHLGAHADVPYLVT
jgi:hypothetical protein